MFSRHSHVFNVSPSDYLFLFFISHFHFWVPCVLLVVLVMLCLPRATYHTVPLFFPPLSRSTASTWHHRARRDDAGPQLLQFAIRLRRLHTSLCYDANASYTMVCIHLCWHWGNNPHCAGASSFLKEMQLAPCPVSNCTCQWPPSSSLLPNTCNLSK